MIANIFISPEAMGLISISKTIPTAIENLLVTISNIFLPQFIYYYSKHQIRNLVQYAKFSMKVIALIMIVPISGFIAFGTDFFSLWLPSKTQGEIALIQCLSILALIPYCISMGNYSLFLIDTVTNKLKRPVIATLIISIFSTIVTILCLKFTKLGIYAVAGISSIFWAIKVFIFNTINAAKNLNIKWYTCYFEYLKNIFVFILILIVFMVIKKIIVIEIWKQLLINAIIFAIIGYFIVFCLLFNKNEKNKILNFLKEKLGIKSYKILTILLIVTLIVLSIFSFKKEKIYVGNEGNKSLKLLKNNDNANYVKEEKYMHLSLDDVIEIFRDLTVNEERYNTIFNNKDIKYLKKMHDLYNIKISCYVFYKNDAFSLDKCTDKYKKEFLDNSDWLRFGFHSIDANTNYEKNNNNSLVNDYNKTIMELERIVGEDSIDNCIRLANFKGNYNDVMDLKNNSIQPIVGLLTADDLRNSYYLNEEDNKYIYCHDRMKLDGLYFISTDLRIELIDDINEKIEEFNYATWNNQQEIMEIFSHEWCLNKTNKNKINKLLKELKNKNYRSEFFEDLIETNKFA